MLIEPGRGMSERGARGAVRQSCFRPRKPARKKGPARVSYRATVDVPIATVRTVSGWLTAHRRAHDTRPHQRAATTWVQAVLVLRWLKDGTDVRALARDNDVQVCLELQPRNPVFAFPPRPRARSQWPTATGATPGPRIRPGGSSPSDWGTTPTTGPGSWPPSPRSTRR